MSGRVFIVTPVYRDVPAFLQLYDKIREVVEADPKLKDQPLKFIVADDSAGRDPEIRQLGEHEDIEVITPPFNLGHQRAIVYALRTTADGFDDEDTVITLDADGEDRPEDIPRLLAELDQSDDASAVVLARRTSRKVSLAFKVFYAAFKLFFRALTGTVIRTGNFAAYHGSVVGIIRRHPHFDLAYSSALNALDLEVHLVPCARGARYAGESRMNLQRLIQHGLSMLVPFTDRLALRAMLAFGTTVMLSVAMAVTLVVLRLAGTDVPDWTLYTLLGLFVCALISLGNFVVLFVVFSQSRGVSLSGLEQDRR